jgi:hypothetical protein
MRTQHECMHVPDGLDEVLCVECVCRQVRSAHICIGTQKFSKMQRSKTRCDNTIKRARKVSQGKPHHHITDNERSGARVHLPRDPRCRLWTAVVAERTPCQWPICGHAIARTIRSDPPHTTHASTTPLHRGCVVDVSVVTVLVAVVVWAITPDLSIAPTTMATAKSRAIVAKATPLLVFESTKMMMRSTSLSRSHGPFRTFDFWDILSITA